MAALINRIRAGDCWDVRAPPERSGNTSDGHPDHPEPSEDVASAIDWDPLCTNLGAFGETPSNPYSLDPLYACMPYNIPVDPALAAFDPQLNQHAQQPDTTYSAHSIAMFPQSSQDHNPSLWNLPVSNSVAPVSARSFFHTQTPSMIRYNVSNIRLGMALQESSLLGVGPVYSESQVDSLFSNVEENADHKITGACLCQLSSLATVAVQCLRGYLQPGVIEFFYGRPPECSFHGIQ